MASTSNHSPAALVSRSLWYTGPERAEIRTEELKPLPAGAVQVRSLFGALSRGTESLVYRGLVPEGEFERMRAPFMEGIFPYPVKYGYSTVGRVEEGPSSLLGKFVFSLTPHQTLYQMDSNDVVFIPGEIKPERAVLAANMETALNAVWDAAPGPGDKIAIIGAGVVGCLVAYLCAHLPGTEVTLVDIKSERAAIAQALGVRFSLPECAPVDCDIVIHCSASASGLATALACAGDEATVLELSWYGATSISAPLGGAFHSRQIRLQSSQVGHISTSRRPRWTYRRRLSAAIGMLNDVRLDVLLTPAVEFDELPARLPEILGQQSDALCCLIRYP
ncbi:dehydrogenase [Polynucleobacter sp. TUM22923]|uniref:zinc-dependent alcohol dehydrogenase n=1 Tax=Polynucleobacter sp. TUM22923 TaxID=3022126 RepID=UPI002572C608|nr:zinc-binding alcohol dehydrogenase [Polynucleobacter sp. TUM22923]BDX22096.1 dehydrogenase [Polynucleobacter sp. TUM22923]